MQHTSILLLGSNHTESITYLQRATNAIRESIGLVAAISKIYKSEPWGFESKNWFFNCALKVETSLNAQELLQALKQIEGLLGRTQNQVFDSSGTRIYTDRPIDCDILSFNNEIVEDSNLTIPHKELENRKFALLPLRDVAAEWVHPKKNKPISTLINECLDTSFVAPIKERAIV